MYKSEKIHYNRESVYKDSEHITLTKHLFPSLIEIPYKGNELLLRRVELGFTYGPLGCKITSL